MTAILYIGEKEILPETLKIEVRHFPKNTQNPYVTEEQAGDE